MRMRRCSRWIRPDLPTMVSSIVDSADQASPWSPSRRNIASASGCETGRENVTSVPVAPLAIAVRSFAVVATTTTRSASRPAPRASTTRPVNENVLSEISTMLRPASCV